MIVVFESEKDKLFKTISNGGVIDGGKLTGAYSKCNRILLLKWNPVSRVNGCSSFLVEENFGYCRCLIFLAFFL